MKKNINVVTIQDISCFGKCSLTVALPIISAMGISCAIIPTAVLSTHTGGFKGYTFRDLSDDILPIAEHWKKENLKFEGIYTGYLGSAEQIELVKTFFEMHGKDGLIFVDPAMADNGVLYTGFDKPFAKKMGTLAAKANMVVPNITEAVMMLDMKYKDKGYDRKYIEDILKALAETGPEVSILTGVSFDPEKQGAVAFDKKTNTFHEYYRENIPVAMHGTGDVFASAMFGSVMKGLSLDDSLKTAVDFTVSSIKATLGDPEHWYGVKFEKCLSELTD